MKTEREIRAHLENLRVAMKMPCGCAGTRHEEKCHRGLMMMQSTAQTLAWALGENEGMADLVERMAADVARFKVGG